MSVSAACYSRMLRCLLNAQTTEGTYIWIGNQVAANATVLYPETMHWPLQGATLINHLTLRNRSCPLFRTFATDSHRSAGQSYRLQQKTLNASHATPTCYNHAASGARYAEETYLSKTKLWATTMIRFNLHTAACPESRNKEMQNRLPQEK